VFAARLRMRSESVESCEKWANSTTQQVDLAFNVFFMIYFFIRVTRHSLTHSLTQLPRPFITPSAAGLLLSAVPAGDRKIGVSALIHSTHAL